MDKEVLEKIEKLESELSRAKEQILTGLDVYTHKLDGNMNALLLQNQLLRHHIEKYFDYENYFNKQNSPNKLKE